MTDLDFDLTVTRDGGGACHVALRGELDLATAARLEQALAEAGDEVVLDLRGLTFMDSTGVRVLLEAAAGHGPGLRMIAPTEGEVRTTIDETGIAPLLPLVEPGSENAQ